MLLLVNNVVQKMCMQVTNTISLHKLTNAFLLLICFKLAIKSMKVLKKYLWNVKKLKTNLKQINNKKTLVNLYEDIVLVTRERIFCTTMFTNNNIKIVIKSSTVLDHHFTNE